MKKIISFIMMALIVLTIPSCSCKKERVPYGAYVEKDLYNVGLSNTDPTDLVMLVEKYEFNEVYLSKNIMPDTQVWVNSLNKAGADVYYLFKDTQHINFISVLENMVDAYKRYNEVYPEYAFKGVHISIDVQNFEEFHVSREQAFYNLIDAAYKLDEKYPEIHFDYDIHSWYDDEITYNGVTKKAYEHMLDVADRIFVMCYANDVDGIYEVAKEELQYGRSLGKPVVLTAMAEKLENGETSFYNKSMDYFKSTVKELKKKDFYNGMSIHDISDFYKLENKVEVEK